MVVLQSLKSITIESLDALVRARSFLVALITIGLGILFGYLIDSPEAGELIVSIVVIMIVLVTIISNPLNGMLIWLFFHIFIETWIELPMGEGIPDLSFSRFTIAFLAIFMLALAAIGKFRFARIGLTEVCILATTVGIMLAAPISQGPPISVVQETISMHFTALVIFFFAKNLVQNRHDLHKLLWTIVLLGFVSGAYAIFEYHTHHVLFVAKDKEITNFFRGDTGIWMIRGIWGGTGAMGRTLAITIPVTFYVFLERKKNDLLKILLVGMLAAQFYGIVIAMSRTPWYALLIALFVMQLFYAQFRKTFLIIVLAGAVVLWATWDQVAESDAAGRVNDKVSTLEGRQARWQAGINMWKAKPIRGWGFGWYEQESGRFRTDGERRNFFAIENDYLHILVGTGLIGFLPYLLFLLVPLINSIRLFFRARAPDWPGFVKPETFSLYWAVFICLAVTSYTAIHTSPVLKMMVFAVAGAVVGTHEYLLRQSSKTKYIN